MSHCASREKIAIVGMAGLFPGAATLDDFWNNISAGVDCSQEVPSGRWSIPADDAYSPEIGRIDHVYSKRGYFLDDVPIEADGLAISQSDLVKLDPSVRLAVTLAHRAWDSANANTADPKRVGIMLGHIALPTEFASRRSTELLEHIYRTGKVDGATSQIDPRNRFVAGWPAIVVAKALGLGGTAFTLDAACASSLNALKLACDALQDGRADAMLAGGLSRPDCLYTQMGFSQLRALASQRCAPFDAAADGLMVGEGGGIFVLKRLADAERGGDTIHGVICGIGLSNDRAGNLLAPASEGQLRAMRAAYTEAGWSPEDVQLIECHATGTRVGDATEFRSLKELWGTACHVGQCVIGSVKSTVGHLLTGAGAAGLVKVLRALREAKLPRTANFRSAATGIDLPRSRFRILNQTEDWPTSTGGPRRAAISGFGFGGINAHVLIEEYRCPRSAVSAKPLPANPKPQPIAIIGLAVRAGQATNACEFGERLFSPNNDPLGSISELGVPLGRFAIPPRELEAMLPQQTLALLTATEALEDADITELPDPDRTGVYLGMVLDQNTTNFHFRWSLKPQERDEVQPLTADRTMGALASIAASRIGRAIRSGGPCFALSSEETSGARALELAISALRRGEISMALAGAVDLPNDFRVRNVVPNDQQPTDAAVTLVLQRLEDAQKDGRRIYGVIEDDVVADSDVHVRSQMFAGAASCMLEVASACIAFEQKSLPISGTKAAQYWLRNADDTRRRVRVTESDSGVNPTSFTLSEVSDNSSAAKWKTPTSEHLIFISCDSILSLRDEVRRLVALAKAGESLSNIAHQCLKQSSLHRGCRLAILACNLDQLYDALAFIEARLAGGEMPVDPPAQFRDRLFCSASFLAGTGSLAFVFPGSGNHFAGMGRELGLAFPNVLRRHERENSSLRSQWQPETIWSEDCRDINPSSALFAQVVYGTLVSDLLAEFGVRPSAAIGISLGTSASFFGLRAWTERDEMYRRIQSSTLFTHELAGPCRAANETWGRPVNEPVDWLTGVIGCSAEVVREKLAGIERAYLLTINSPNECTIGGERAAVERLIAHLGGAFVPLFGVSIAHCEVVKPVADAYRALHVLPVTPPLGVDFYHQISCQRFVPDFESAADAVLAQASHTVNIPAIIESAYRDGVRFFLEIGPGSSATRMIGKILEGRPHVARSAGPGRGDEVGNVLRVLAELFVAGYGVDLAPLYPQQQFHQSMDTKEVIHLPVRPFPFELRPRPQGKTALRQPITTTPNPLPPPSGLAPRISGPLPPCGGGLGWGVEPSRAPTPHPSPPPQGGRGPEGCGKGQDGCGRDEEGGKRVQSISAIQQFGGIAESATDTIFASAARAQLATVRAHADFLRFTNATQAHVAALLTGNVVLEDFQPAEVLTHEAPTALDRSQCLAFATGDVAPVVGPRFAEIDYFPTRVRLPDEPLMLVDRILAIEAQPLSLSHGRVITEHDVTADRWYLDHNRIPVCIAVEAGQADLFLSGYLGIDLHTRGLAVYRLLDAVVTFHSDLPSPPSVIRYDIHIDRFFRQGETYLFRFRFVGTVDGEPLLTMTDGCAGFFTADELAAGKGIVHTELDRRPITGKKPDAWAPLVEMHDVESYDDSQIETLRRGDLASCFGPAFVGLPLANPLRLPGGQMHLVDRITHLDPNGGRFGLGLIRGEADVRPDDWYLTCHFIDDMVMPGTLMYECCLHTLRVFLMRLGWVGEHDKVAWQPVAGDAARLRCRGQVTTATRKVTYEVSIKELGYRPEPYALADVLMYADGKPIVEMLGMSVRLTGTNRERLEQIWHRQPSAVAYDRDRILAFAIGKPSEAFGDRYLAFDHDRVIARLPGPPYSFLDGIIAVEGEPWIMRAGSSAVAEYEVPPNEWYFRANCQPTMPFAVLLEIALQPCGWLAAYVGSALTSETDLSFRNLGGKATLHQSVSPTTGTLTTRVKLTNVSHSGGMIIQHYEFDMRDRAGRPVYDGTTYFGFFSKKALADQVGLRDFDKLGDGKAGEEFLFPQAPPFPDARLQMIDRVSRYCPDGGRAKLGFIEGTKRVDPAEWFFKAHFHQDPVMPGSLGLEAMQQLLLVVAERRWGLSDHLTWQSVAVKQPHEWVYRGQVIPSNSQVTVQAEVTTIEDSCRLLRAKGLLFVDGRPIYRMTDFSLQGWGT
ncbi:MAG: beta-ketoacyl synthase N-terminal-like domain-containing protein [Gemmataceae bacterium]